MEIPTNHTFMEPLPVDQFWGVQIQRTMCPRAYVQTSSGEVITEFSLDPHDVAIGADVLRHLIEAHNFWLKEKTRSRK